MFDTSANTEKNLWVHKQKNPSFKILLLKAQGEHYKAAVRKINPEKNRRYENQTRYVIRLTKRERQEVTTAFTVR